MDRSANGILIIDSEPARQDQVKHLLASIGRTVASGAAPGEWRYRLQRETGIGSVLLGPVGAAEQLRLYESLREEYPLLPVILYGAPPGSAQAVQEAGAGSFVRSLALPLEAGSLNEALEEARRYAARQPAQARGPELFRSLVGRSDGIRKVRELIQRAAPTDSTVLILGEAGTGKEVVARNLHYHSARRGQPFVALDCSAVPAALLEGELFGEAAPGGGRAGRFEQAAGGTLFLDGIDAASPAVQVKLLRVLQERVFERAGDARALPAQVRLVAASARNLEREARDGRFREDLYYRLNLFPIVMPPLRERADDIPLLVAEVNARLRQERGVAVRLSHEALASLQRYAWPGNVRELANLVERLAIVHGDAPIEAQDLPPRYRAARARAAAASNAHPLPLPTLPDAGLNLKEYLGNVEYGLIVQALTRTGGVVAHAAELLGLRRTTLVEKLHKYGVRRDAPARARAAARDDKLAAG